MEHLEVTAEMSSGGTVYTVRVWNCYWQKTLGDPPDRTYIRHNPGMLAYELQQELLGKRSRMKLPNR